jgi:hypothetical protein
MPQKKTVYGLISACTTSVKKKMYQFKKKMNCKHLKPVCPPPVYCRGFTGATGPAGIGATGLSGATGPTGVGGGGLFSGLEPIVINGGSGFLQSMVQSGTEPVMQTENIIQNGDQYLYTTGGYMSSDGTDTFTFQLEVTPATPPPPLFNVQPGTGIRPFKLEILCTFVSTGMFVAATLTIGGNFDNLSLNIPAAVYQYQVSQGPALSGPREFIVRTNGGASNASSLECNYGVLTKPY